MKHLKPFLILAVSILFLFAMAGTSLAAGGKCPICGMNLEGNENTAYEITFTDGKTVTYCCAHCGLWDHAAMKDKVKSARTRDFISGEWIDPSKAVFLFNSSAVPACAPSWIAFGNKAEAEKFRKGFGGKILSFDEAIKERPKHPKDMEMKKMKK
jgi:nitrous oxide reductase accessory protein NosL